MKKIAKVFAMIVCIASLGLMISCSKDNAELIIGKWKWVSVTNDGTTIQMPEDNITTWEFTESGNVIMTMNGEAATGDYTVDGDKLSISGSYVGNTVCKILKLTKKELSVESEGMTINMTKI